MARNKVTPIFKTTEEGDFFLDQEGKLWQFCKMTGELIRREDLKVIRFTGCYDRKNQPIYENNKVKIDRKVYKVKFDKASASFVLRTRGYDLPLLPSSKKDYILANKSVMRQFKDEEEEE